MVVIAVAIGIPRGDLPFEATSRLLLYYRVPLWTTHVARGCMFERARKRHTALSRRNEAFPPADARRNASRENREEKKKR